ncbi:hypothetical protein OF83DRAFT_193581 [Amylostereum chailletii]|nr:hypothetical protein OF83DRAFT_193581 [Amylostereum chailletii]
MLVQRNRPEKRKRRKTKNEGSMQTPECHWGAWTTTVGVYESLSDRDCAAIDVSSAVDSPWRWRDPATRRPPQPTPTLTTMTSLSLPISKHRVSSVGPVYASTAVELAVDTYFGSKNPWRERPENHSPRLSERCCQLLRLLQMRAMAVGIYVCRSRSQYYDEYDTHAPIKPSLSPAQLLTVTSPDLCGGAMTGLHKIRTSPRAPTASQAVNQMITWGILLIGLSEGTRGHACMPRGR